MEIVARITNQPNKQNKCVVYFDIHLDGVRFKISSGISCEKEAFNNESITNSKLNNSLLQARKSALLNIESRAELDGVTLTKDSLKKAYQNLIKKPDQNPKKDKNLTIVEYFEHYKKKYESIKSYHQLRRGNQVIDKMVEFDPDLSFDSLTPTFWVNYCSFLLEEYELQNSTINGHAKKIKEVLEDALEEGYKFPLHFKKFKFKHSRIQPFWATWDEINAIQSAYCLRKSEEVIRDSFIITANLGIRNSDFNLIKKENYYTDKNLHFLRVVIKKTDLDYSIPLNPTALRLLQKYDFNIPIYHINTFNDYIKQVASRVVKGWYNKIKLIGKRREESKVKRYTLFTTHTARRTFGRKWLDEGGSLIILSKLFGHASTETTLLYIGYTAEEITEEFLKVFSS